MCERSQFLLAQLLGIRANKQEIADMLEKAGADEASELDSDAFKRIMTGVLTKSDATPTTSALVCCEDLDQPACRGVA
jgi:Ca2+-binding EF-hand superfamily protein